MTEKLPRLSETLARVLELDRTVRAIEFQGSWYSWGDLSATAESVGALVGQGDRVGLLARNAPLHVGLVVGLLRAGACVVVINPGRGTDRVREEIAELDLPVIAGSQPDLEQFAGNSPRALGLAGNRLGCPVEAHGDPARRGEPWAEGVAVQTLTSGTTGPPKRVPLTYETLHRVLVGAKYYERDSAPQVRLRSGVAIVNSPLVHLGGLFRVLQCVTDGRSFCLLERFRVDEWADAVRRHRPATASLVPAALRMVLEADLPPADLSSLRSVISGTAPLAPEDADAFHEKYGVPVLVSYAATEFGGGVAGWNLSEYERYWPIKRGSVGRAHPGCELRVVDPGTGVVLAPAHEGLLEVKAQQMGDGAGWTRTTDLARIDDDGFVWILGRADQAIIRGGFKIRPDDVRSALERDPRVRMAAVIGRPDDRLGAVPVAAVELRADAGPTSPDDLLRTVSSTLAPYEIPVELRLLDRVPTTPAGKVDLTALREVLAESEQGDQT
jgi:acyl-CoA synthetase (AMP-forming)/AMP-acid ligase II